MPVPTGAKLTHSVVSALNGTKHCQSKVPQQQWHSVGLLVGWQEEDDDGK